MFFHLNHVMYQTEVDFMRCKNHVSTIGRTKKTVNFEKFRCQFRKELQVWKTNIIVRHPVEMSFTTWDIFDKIQTGQIMIRGHIRNRNRSAKRIGKMCIAILHQSSDAACNFVSLYYIENSSHSSSMNNIPAFITNMTIEVFWSWSCASVRASD